MCPQLLGLESDDLDICISSLTGHHFATLLEGYLHELRERPNGLNDDSALMQSTRIAKIQANPDQSKHLETARMTVGGLEIDLVQLRSEEYADGSAGTLNGEEGSSGSRIPTSVVRPYLSLAWRLASPGLLKRKRTAPALEIRNTPGRRPAQRHYHQHPLLQRSLAPGRGSNGQGEACSSAMRSRAQCCEGITGCIQHSLSEYLLLAPARVRTGPRRPPLLLASHPYASRAAPDLPR